MKGGWWKKGREDDDAIIYMIMWCTAYDVGKVKKIMKSGFHPDSF